jgi:hypothetical protein
MGFFRFFLAVFFFGAFLAVLGVWGIISLAFGGGLGAGFLITAGIIGIMGSLGAVGGVSSAREDKQSIVGGAGLWQLSSTPSKDEQSIVGDAGLGQLSSTLEPSVVDSVLFGARDKLPIAGVGLSLNVLNSSVGLSDIISKTSEIGVAWRGTKLLGGARLLDNGNTGREAGF